MSEKIQVRRHPEQKRSRNTVSAIKESAAYLFGKDGIDSTSMTQIAEKAGMSKPALYRYYPNKRALLRSLTLDSFEEYREQIQARFIGTSSEPRKVMFEGLKAYCLIHVAEPYRIQLRAAVLADPELSELDIKDTRENAEIISNFVIRCFPNAETEKIKMRIMMMNELTDSLIRFVAKAKTEDVDAIIEDYIRGFTSDLD